MYYISVYLSVKSYIVGTFWNPATICNISPVVSQVLKKNVNFWNTSRPHLRDSDYL